MSAPFIVLIEGPDGAGKTTYAAKLKGERQDVLIVHNGPPPAVTNLYRLYLSQIKTAVANTKSGLSTVIDRSFLSERIYGVLRPGGPRISDRQVRRLEKYARRHGVILIGYQAHPILREQRILARGEEFDVITDAYVARAYRRHFEARASFWYSAEGNSATL